MWDLDTTSGFQSQLVAEKEADGKPHFRVRIPTEEGGFERADERVATITVGLLQDMLGNIEIPPRQLAGNHHRNRRTQRHLGAVVKSWLDGR